MMRARAPHLAVAALVAGLAAAAPASAMPVDAAAPPAKQATPAQRSAPAVAALALTAVPVTGSVDLCAKPGTLSVAGTTVDVWGYAVGTCAAAGAPTLPGPVLEIAQGATVTITLHNGLGGAERTSLLLPGQQGLVPDTTGVAPGGSRAYTFTAGDPGTYLYESGTNSARQVPMGLHGALLVRPATAGQAYGPGTEYDVEATLVLSEIDPALNADPTGFDMQDYAPQLWLINGEAYPDTDVITAGAGDDVLLRFANAGSEHHTMALLGAHERIVAKDAEPEPDPFLSVAETIAAGQTVDAIVTAGAAGSRMPLYERQMRVVNGSAYPGGMLTFLQVP